MPDSNHDYELHNSETINSRMLTVFIPTFNRGPRLAQNIEKVLGEISMYGQEKEIALLVGDNCSSDSTFEICSKYSLLAKQKNISFLYFRNSENLGLNGNIMAGLQKVKRGFVLLLSDDDELFGGGLSTILFDLGKYEPDIAIYNFNQKPFDTDNPLIKEKIFIDSSRNYEILGSLILWPKLTGIVVNSELIDEDCYKFTDLMKSSNHFPHVTLTAFCFQKRGRVLKSDYFLAGPDNDYLDHVNFPWYVGEHLIKELIYFRHLFEIFNSTLDKQIETRPKVDVLESSISHLVLYYAGKSRITPSLKSVLWSNIYQFLKFQKTNSEGLVIQLSSFRALKKLILLLVLYPFTPILSLFGRKPKLMNEGF